MKDDSEFGRSDPDRPQAWPLLPLAADEKVVWSGRPCSRLAYAVKQLTLGLVGVGFVVFTLTWMSMVVRGGGNWDRGRDVPPFAEHNVVIAAVAGVIFLPYGLIMLTAPIGAWLRAPGTAYVLTNRRALVCEPRVFGGVSVREFPASALGEMRCSEGVGGTGDLILGTKGTLVRGMTQPDGFLAVGDVRAVESLVRKTFSRDD